VSRASAIDGVVVVPLKLLPNARGRLMEIVRRSDPDVIAFEQVYLTSTYPGVVKAWYRHHHQVDQIASISGLVRLVLFDGREDSPSSGAIQEIHLGDLAPRLVRIPPGVWHGFQAVGIHEAFLLHLNSHAFDPAQPDEDRLDPDDPRIPFVW
jgi:dTDP-4-dehydrorhamnose 3,5-epimerase